MTELAPRPQPRARGQYTPAHHLTVRQQAVEALLLDARTPAPPPPGESV